MSDFCNPLERNSLGQKQCNVCKLWKDENEFSKHKNAKDNLQACCKSCQKEKMKKSREKNRTTPPYVAKALLRNEQGQKQCSKCKQWKNESEFTIQRSSKDGLSSICRNCQHNYDMARSKQRSEKYNQLKEQERKQNEKYNENGQLLQQCYNCGEYKELNKLNFPICKRNKSGYSSVCKVCLKKQIEIRNAKLSEEEKEKLRLKKIEYMRKYREENREIINAKKRKENLTQNQILGHTISSAIYRGLQGVKADRHWEDIVGYSLQELKEHLEEQFTPEMNWDNMGEYWEIDHIIPLNLFKYETEHDEQFKICWSLANLRPLEKIANKSRPKNGRDISKEQAISILGHDLYYDIMKP